MAYSKFDLTGKGALVTGGNSGIGLGFARALAEAGAAVCIWGTNEAKNEAAEAELKEIGGKVLALKCDVSDKEQVNGAVEETARQLGQVDILINDAVSPYLTGSLEELDDTE